MKSETLAADRGDLNFSSLSLYRNALYGVAAIWIVLFHGVILKKVEFPDSLWFIKDTFELGNIGVDIFVLLSGMGLYFAFSKKPKLGVFYYKRFVRIYLSYFLMAVPFLVYACLIADHNVGLFIRQVLTINLWTGENQPLDLWYVSAILVFYLIYPLIHQAIFFSKRGALVRMIALAAVTVIITYLLFLYAKDAYALLDRVLPRLTVFILGCYFGKLVKEKRKIPVLVIILSVVVIAFAYPLYARSGIKGFFRRYYGSLTGVALTFVLSQAFVDLSRIKLDRFFAFFGAFSLEIYISTIIVRTIFAQTEFYGGHVFRNYLIWMAGAMVIAYLVSLLEKPILKLLLKPVSKKKQ